MTGVLCSIRRVGSGDDVRAAFTRVPVIGERVVCADLDRVNRFSVYQVQLVTHWSMDIAECAGREYAATLHVIDAPLPALPLPVTAGT